MNQVDYKKKYDEALERMKSWARGEHPECFTEARKAAEFIFPELAESEDERIRKEMIEILKKESHEFPSSVIANKSSSWIAWLEKQDEKIQYWKPSEEQLEALDFAYNTCPDTERGNYYEGVLETLIDDLHRFEKQSKQGNQHLYDIIIALWDLLDKIDTFADLQIDDTDPDNPFRKIEHITGERHEFVKSDGYNLYIKGEKITDFQEQKTMMRNSTKESKCEENDSSTACLEKQDEQKPEPKFKVGDWVVVAGKVAQILDIQGNYTVFHDTNGKNFLSDYPFHLWTIQDTHNGDVLKEDSCIFIIERMKPDGTAIVHCCLFDDGDFDLVGSNLHFDVDSTYPATKEQRGLLFQKMKEAGYEWNPEKMELKKIEQKPVWSEEDELNLKQAIYVCHRNGYTAAENWLKSLNPQKHWKPSEYDISLLEEIATKIRTNTKPFCRDVSSLEDLIERLKSL